MCSKVMTTVLSCVSFTSSTFSLLNCRLKYCTKALNGLSPVEQLMPRTSISSLNSIEDEAAGLPLFISRISVHFSVLNDARIRHSCLKYSSRIDMKITVQRKYVLNKRVFLIICNCHKVLLIFHWSHFRLCNIETAMLV